MRREGRRNERRDVRRVGRRDEKREVRREGRRDERKREEQERGMTVLEILKEDATHSLPL